MGQILDFIYNGAEYSELTPVALVCFFVFMLTLECISAIIREVTKGANLR